MYILHLALKTCWLSKCVWSGWTVCMCVVSGAQLNMRAVFLHVLGDALGSVVVIISGVLIKFINADWKYRIDPVLRCANCLLLTFHSSGVTSCQMICSTKHTLQHGNRRQQTLPPVWCCHLVTEFEYIVYVAVTNPCCPLVSHTILVSPAP